MKGRSVMMALQELGGIDCEFLVDDGSGNFRVVTGFYKTGARRVSADIWSFGDQVANANPPEEAIVARIAGPPSDL